MTEWKDRGYYINEWEVQGYYGAQYGWERLTTHDTRDDALRTLTDYDVNEPQYRHRIKRKTA